MKKKPKPLTAWSYSRLACFESCAFLHKCRNIDKLFEPKNDAMFRGIKIHDEAAKFLAGETDIFPASCEKFMDQFYELRTFNPIVEQKWAFNKNWYSKSWFDAKVRVRVIADAAIIYGDGEAEVIDHKTGKRYDDDYRDQLGLFAAAMIKKHPSEVDRVTTRLWYLDSGDEVVEEFTKKQAFEVLADLEERAELMLTTDRFPPMPSWKCRFCHFRRENDGPCKF